MAAIGHGGLRDHCLRDSVYGLASGALLLLGVWFAIELVIHKPMDQLAGAVCVAALHGDNELDKQYPHHHQLAADPARADDFFVGLYPNLLGEVHSQRRGGRRHLSFDATSTVRGVGGHGVRDLSILVAFYRVADLRHDVVLVLPVGTG